MITSLTMSAWRVVHFPKENTVEAVPVLWMKGTHQCFWPSFSGLKLKTAISKCIPPSSDWEIYEARVIGEEYVDFSVARMKALEAENTSDLNSDSDSLGLGHRRIRKNRKYQESDTDQDEDRTPSPEQSEILMPVLKRGTNISAVFTSDDLGSDSTSVCRKSATVNERNNSEGNQTNKVNESAIGLKTNEVSSNIETIRDEQFKRQVLRNLSIIHFKLEQLAEDISMIATKKPEVPVSSSIFLKYNFPLSTEDELQIFETYLSNIDNYNQVQLEFSRIGGSNTKIMVKRILDKILSSQLGMTYSWIGFKKKKNFSVLFTAKVLIDAVMAVIQKSNAAEVEATVKQWLVKCKERHNKENNHP